MRAKRRRAVLTLAIGTFVLYLAGYAGARGGHRLVRYEAGCIGQPDLHPDFRAHGWQCSELHAAESAHGRSAWQVAYVPLVALEEWLRNSGCYDDTHAERSAFEAARLVDGNVRRRLFADVEHTDRSSGCGRGWVLGPILRSARIHEGMRDEG